MDEAKKKKIQIDLQELSFLLGIPVVGTSARSGTGLEELMDSVEAVSFDRRKTTPKQVVYPELLEKAVSILQPAVKQALTKPLNERWVSSVSYTHLRVGRRFRDGRRQGDVALL